MVARALRRRCCRLEVRDAVAAWHLSRPTLASWQRQRFQIRRCAHPQRVLMTGATRFIGRIVASRVIEHGHIVAVLYRNPAIGSGPGFAFHIHITLPECGY